MEMGLVNLYPLPLVIDDNKVIFHDYEEHLRYVYSHEFSWSYYDDIVANNESLQKWNKNKTNFPSTSAIFKHKNALNQCDLSQINLELDKEFEEINTTLPVGQKLFRVTKLEDVPVTPSIYYMPTSPFPNVYVNGQYAISLVLTIKSPGIRCYYYGDNTDVSQPDDDADNSICEWEVLLQRGLSFTETKRYMIPEETKFGNTIISREERTIIELDVSKPI